MCYKDKIRSRIPYVGTYRTIEPGTEIYHEGEPFVIDSSRYSNYLFVFRDRHFVVQAVGIQEAISYVNETRVHALETIECIPKNQYVVFHLKNTASWHPILDRSKTNNLANQLALLLFEI